MSQLRFDRKWQIQKRTFIDGKFVCTEVLAEVAGFEYAKRIFKELTNLEPREDYYTICGVMKELGDSPEGFLKDYTRAAKIAFNRNFIPVPFADGRGCFAYGIKSVVIVKRDSPEDKLS